MSVNHPVAEDIRRLDRMRSETSAWSLGSFIAIVAILALGTWNVISGVRDLFRAGPVQNEFAADLVSRLNSDVLPDVQKLAGEAITQSQPAVQAQFQQLSGRLPDVSNAFMEQFTQLQQNLPVQGQKVLSDTFGETLQAEVPKIQQMYPDVTKDNITTAVDNISSATQQQIGSASTKMFSKHVEALKGIIGDMRTIEASEPINPNQDKANLQMAMALIGAFHSDLTGAKLQSDETASSKPAKEAKK